MTWEWYDEVPDTEEVIEQLESLPDVWGVRVADYWEYVLPMTKNQKIETSPGVEKRVPVTKLYMQVAGRIKMLEEASEKHGLIVDEACMTISNDPIVRQIVLEIRPPQGAQKVEGLPHGSRYGIAKIKGGEWEKMETAARGRALGAWGFGVLPGSGIASYEEMEFVGVEFTEETEEVKKKSRDEIIEEIGTRRTELAQARGVDIEEVDKGLQAYVLRRWGKKVKITEEGLDLSELKDGYLVLMHNDLINQLKRAQALEQGKLDAED